MDMRAGVVCTRRTRLAPPAAGKHTIFYGQSAYTDTANEEEDIDCETQGHVQCVPTPKLGKPDRIRKLNGPRTQFSAFSKHIARMAAQHADAELAAGAPVATVDVYTQQRASLEKQFQNNVRKIEANTARLSADAVCAAVAAEESMHRVRLSGLATVQAAEEAARRRKVAAAIKPGSSELPKAAVWKAVRVSPSLEVQRAAAVQRLLREETDDSMVDTTNLSLHSAADRRLRKTVDLV